MFICNHLGGCDPLSNTSTYNDIPITYDEEKYNELRESGTQCAATQQRVLARMRMQHSAAQRHAHTGMDDLLAKHVSHLFVRDPLVIFKERIEMDAQTNVDHFENLQARTHAHMHAHGHAHGHT